VTSGFTRDKCGTILWSSQKSVRRIPSLKTRVMTGDFRFVTVGVQFVDNSQVIDSWGARSPPRK